MQAPWSWSGPRLGPLFVFAKEKALAKGLCAAESAPRESPPLSARRRVRTTEEFAPCVSPPQSARVWPLCYELELGFH